MLGYIPSPSTNGISVGPLRLHMYGFLIVAGVFAAVWLADRRWRARGGERGTFSAIAVWGVPGGLIGARLYHVATDYELYTHRPFDAFKIWQGGLGIWGGIAGGVLAGWIYIRRHNLDFPAVLDCVAPALPLAQAIGRWGNYFNQELFGRPTSLPWGLKIDQSNVSGLFANVNKPVPPAYLHAAGFHPTFLYESLWDLAVVLLVLLTEKHVRLRKGYLFAVYAALYTFGRFFTEYLRIDFAHKIFGLRINDWASVIIFVAATTLVLRKGLRRREEATVDEPQQEESLVAVAGRPPGARGSMSGETLEESTGLLTQDDVAGAPAAAAVVESPAASDPVEPSSPAPDEPSAPAEPPAPPAPEPIVASAEPGKAIATPPSSQPIPTPSETVVEPEEQPLG